MTAAELREIQASDDAGRVDYDSERARLDAAFRRLSKPQLITLAREMGVVAVLATKERAVQKLLHKTLEASEARLAIAY